MTVVRGNEQARRQYLVSCPHCDASNPVNAMACWHCEQDLRQAPAVANEATGGSGAAPLEPLPVEPPAEPPAAPADAPPSFFPVLRAEVDDRTAHNDSLWESASAPSFLVDGPAPGDDGRPAARAPLLRRPILAAVGGAVAASLVFVLMGRSGDAPVAPVATGDPPGSAAAGPVARPIPVMPVLAEPPAAEVRPTAPAVPTAAAAAKGPERPEAAGAGGVRADAEPRAPARSVRPVRTEAPAPARVAEPVARVAEPPAPAPAPVKGPCTPNIAALGLCSIDTP